MNLSTKLLDFLNQKFNVTSLILTKWMSKILGKKKFFLENLYSNPIT